MNKVQLFGLIVLLVSLVSCNGSAEAEVEVFPSDTTLVDDSYPPLDNEEVLKIMDAIQVCTLSDTVDHLPPCTNEYFRIFPLGPEMPYEKAFILEMKAGLFRSPVKQILVLEKTFNKFNIVNQYFGYLIEYRTSVTGYNDLLIGYEDPDIGVVAIKHIWMNQHYEPFDVEEINGHFIKPELKDSINDIFLNSFNAGY